MSFVFVLITGTAGVRGSEAFGGEISEAEGKEQEGLGKREEKKSKEREHKYLAFCLP
jgi:hypothetical protein